ncbi:MAG: cyclic nucleotide-binding domain-containing protein [Fuerstiella sp.]|nr:cyclic nucleotide-binding domain-containing protein [Fuerstiella sp.]
MTDLKHEPTADKLSGDWQTLLDSLGQRVENIQLTPGQRFFSQRDISDALYILISGELAVRVCPRGSHLEQVIAHIRPVEPTLENMLAYTEPL